MKILHTSDWHLGKKLDTFSRHQEQVEVLHEILQIAESENVDAIIIAGDLFDTFNPPVESVELFYKTLKQLSNNGNRAVICIAGNHDSPDRIEAPDPLARELGILFIGYPDSTIPLFKLDSGIEVCQSAPGFVELKLIRCNEHLRVLTTPYANEIRLKSFLGIDDPETELRNVLYEHWSTLANRYCDNLGINILVAHLYFTKEGVPLQVEPDDEKPILHVGGAQAIYSKNIPKQLQYVALGHLHRKQIIDQEPCPIVYSGSPIPYSFSESDQKKFVLIVDLEPNKTAVVTPKVLQKGFPLKRFRSLGVTQAIEWLEQNQNCLVELTIVTDTYLNAADRKLLLQIHPAIIQIIPEMGGKHSSDTDVTNNSRNLNKSIEELFVEYFEHVKGLPPDNQILDLFKEIISTTNEE